MENKEVVEEFLTTLEDFNPTIPDEITQYYLNRTGFSSSDEKLTKFISLAAQKFISEICYDTMQFTKMRIAANKSKNPKDKKLVLMMEDLQQALKEYGINVKKPEYFADKPAPVTKPGKKE